MTRGETIINNLFLIAGALMIANYLVLGVCVRFGQSLMFLWPLAGALCVGRYFFWRHAAAVGRLPAGAWFTALRIAVLALLAFFLAVEGFIFAGGLTKAPAGLDYIVVLGARVNPDGPSGALRNRVEVAVQYLRDNPDCIAVLSGGQGADEPESEADCMYRLMTEAGIAPERLLLEDKSTNTAENLRFSAGLVPEGAHVGLVTNNFHIFRALSLARGVGWEQVSPVPVATSPVSWPHYMMREFFGLMYDGLQGRLKF